MTALKLFVSHSSRLDDVEHKHTREEHNWRLLDDTCQAIRLKYGNRVEVLVDKDGLVPGDDWNHQLNLWLAACHVAIILFSRRAIEKSDWVAKEAAILSWRAELDEDFTLIPVMLDGQSTPEDLAKEFFGVLKIDAHQCIRQAQTPEDIPTGIAPGLGEPEDLAGEYPQTPLGSLQGGYAKLLSEGTTTASLKEALHAVGCAAASGGAPSHQRYAELLARQFLKTRPEATSACFRTSKDGLSCLLDGLRVAFGPDEFENRRVLVIDLIGLRPRGAGDVLADLADGGAPFLLRRRLGIQLLQQPVEVSCVDGLGGRQRPEQVGDVGVAFGLGLGGVGVVCAVGGYLVGIALLQGSGGGRVGGGLGLGRVRRGRQGVPEGQAQQHKVEPRGQS